MSTTQKQRAGAGRASTGTDATGEVQPEAQVSFTAKLVILGEASGADLSDYAGEPVLIFVADPEEVRKAAPLFNRPVALVADHNAALEEMRLRAESAEARIASVSGVTREDLAKREYERGSTEGAQQLDAAREAAAEAFDSALLAFGQVQEQLAAVTEQRDDLLAVLRGFAKMETPTERADRLEGTGEEYDHDDNIIVLGHLIEAARTATTKAEGR